MIIKQAEAENEKAYFAQDQPEQGEFETEYEEEEQPDRLDKPTHNLFIHLSREIRKDANKLKNTLESLVYFFTYIFNVF